jgi:alkanesulfonate monooxygenase SsuD/methylene tetrahydromethanopterin reductase-like flavin-dependent oxidoreductase (luciferase family)
MSFSFGIFDSFNLGDSAPGPVIASRPGAATALRPRLGFAANVYVGATDGAAMDRFRQANDVFARQLTKLWHDHGNHQVDALWDTDRTLANGNSLAGSAATVRDLLIERIRQAPVNYFEATLAFGDLTPAESQANLAAFADAVMPAVREAATAS